MNVKAAWFEGAIYLGIGTVWMEDVLHNVEGDDDIKALIGERLAFEILADPLAYCGAERFVRVVIGTEIVRAFEPELGRDAAPDRRTLMDTKAAPSWPRLGEDVGESALTRDGTAGAVAADVVVAEPRIRPERFVRS